MFVHQVIVSKCLEQTKSALATFPAGSGAAEIREFKLSGSLTILWSSLGLAALDCGVAKRHHVVSEKQLLFFAAIKAGQQQTHTVNMRQNDCLKSECVQKAGLYCIV